MFGLSGEHVVILLIILLIFGPRKLPELGNTLGKAIKNFKDSVSGVEAAKYRNLNENVEKATVVSETKIEPETSTVGMKTPADDTKKS